MRPWGVFLFALSLCAAACSGPDTKLVNQVKTFGPQWVNLKERIDNLEKNLMETQGSFEAHYAEFEDDFHKIRDSLNLSLLDSLTDEYHQILLEREEVHDSLVAIRKRNTETATAYNDWETRVMSGKISSGDASTDLRHYREQLGDMVAHLGKEEKLLKECTERHNQIFRRFASMFNSPVNFDITLKY